MTQNFELRKITPLNFEIYEKNSRMYILIEAKLVSFIYRHLVRFHRTLFSLHHKLIDAVLGTDTVFKMQFGHEFL